MLADLPALVVVGESVELLASGAHDHRGMLKLDADLDRYAQIIAATRPEVLVETGSYTGQSARWFAGRGVQVVSVDINAAARGDDEGITWIAGDSADPLVAELVAAAVGGRRCMVSLDSNHSAAHVAREIGLYGPLVSPGCYLVVEDTIFAYAPSPLAERHGTPPSVGSPLDAVARCLAGSPDWRRDEDIERLHPVSHHPAGWWVRRG